MATRVQVRVPPHQKFRGDAAQAARALLELGLTMREAGQVLGLSHQRVLQLVHRNAAAP